MFSIMSLKFHDKSHVSALEMLPQIVTTLSSQKTNKFLIADAVVKKFANFDLANNALIIRGAGFRADTLKTHTFESKFFSYSRRITKDIYYI